MVIDLAIFISLAAVVLFLTFRFVKTHTHPDRGIWGTFFSTLLLVLLCPIFVAAIAGDLFRAFHLPHQIAVLGFVLTFFATSVAAWIFCRRRMLREKPPRKYWIRKIPKITSHLLFNNYTPWLALVVAITGIFFIHDYNPKGGLLTAIMRGDIYLSDDASVSASPNPYDTIDPPRNAASPSWTSSRSDPYDHSVANMQHRVPYRYLLAACLLIIGLNLGSAQSRLLKRSS